MTFKRIEEITEKQQELLDYLVEHIERYGYQPTTSEMAEHFGCTNRAIFDRLKQLESKGVLVMTDNRDSKSARAITLRHLRFRAVPAQV